MTTRRLSFSLAASLVCLSAVSLASAQQTPAPEAPPGATSTAPKPAAPQPAEEGERTRSEGAAPAETGSELVTEPAASDAATAPPAEEVAVALPPPPAGSGGIAVFPVTSTNLTEGESAALGVLFAAQVREEKGGRLIAPDKASKYSSDSSEQQSAASYMKVEQYLSVEAVRLDRTTIVTATLYNQDGSVVRSAKMSAKSVDDFQYVSERLVSALMSGAPVEKTRTLDNITTEEAEGKNRTFVEKVFGFKTSWVVPYSSQIDLPTMVGVSFDGRLEGKNYFLEFGAGILLPASTYDGGGGHGYGGVFAEIGASYYLTHTSVSPYLGAGVMPRILSTQPANLAAYGQAGVMFFRTSSSRLYAEIRVAQNLTEMEISSYDYDAEGNYSGETVHLWPIEFGLNVGLGW